MWVRRRAPRRRLHHGRVCASWTGDGHTAGPGLHAWPTRGADVAGGRSGEAGVCWTWLVLSAWPGWASRVRAARARKTSRLRRTAPHCTALRTTPLHCGDVVCERGSSVGRVRVRRVAAAATRASFPHVRALCAWRVLRGACTGTDVDTDPATLTHRRSGIDAHAATATAHVRRKVHDCVGTKIRACDTEPPRGTRRGPRQRPAAPLYASKT